MPAADTATPPKAVKPDDATGGKADASVASKDDKETKEAKDAPKVIHVVYGV